MNELLAPDMAMGALALASAIWYAAWHEYAAKNHRMAPTASVTSEAARIPGWMLFFD